MKIHLLLVLSFLLLSVAGFSQEFDTSKLDRYFDALEANNKFMGSVAVSRDGKIIYTRSAGYSNVETMQKANADSRYRIGSITKTFTTVLVMKAVEEKRLSLDQTIENFFPDLPNANKITLRNLLSHRSGIHNFTDDDEYLSWSTQPKTRTELEQIIKNGGSDFEPGSKTEYSNSNFVLLTFLLEDTFKKSYAELLNEIITGPLGLTNTQFGGKIEPGNNECKSYTFNNGWKEEPETDMSIPLGAGGISSTPADLVKFSNALFSGKLLSNKSLEQMQSTTDNMGLGLFKIPFYDLTAYGHSGGIDGFSSIFSHFSDGDVSYAMIRNGVNYNFNAISIAVLSAVYNKPFEIPEFSTYTIPTEELDKYTGIYNSDELKLKLTISKENNTLKAQATGQSAFTLDATAKDVFANDQVGVTFEFNPANNTLVLKQGGGVFTFTRE